MVNTKSNQFTLYLRNQFSYDVRGNSKSTVTFILSYISRIAEILGMSLSEFYLLSDEDHLDYYELLAVELQNMDISITHLRSVKYAYRNYLEFIGNNPYPIGRRRSYQPRTPKIINKKSLKIENEFLNWLKNDSFNMTRKIKNMSYSIKSGINIFCKYQNLSIERFYILEYEELRTMYNNMFSKNDSYPFSLKSHENKIKYSIIRFLKFLRYKSLIEGAKSIKNTTEVSNGMDKKIVINRKLNGEIVINIF